jgi:hypothetical protein
MKGEEATVHRWRARVERALAALGVCVAGYVCLATSDSPDPIGLVAERDVAFLEGEQTHLVRIRVSPATWDGPDMDYGLFVYASSPVTLVQVGSDAQPGGDNGLSLVCGLPQGCSELLVLVDRANLSGSFTTTLTVALRLGLYSAGGRPTMEILVDVAD